MRGDAIDDEEIVLGVRCVGAQLQPTRVQTAEAPEAAVHALPRPWTFHGAHPLRSVDGLRLYGADVLATAVRVLEVGADRTFSHVESPVTGLRWQGAPWW